MEKLPRDKVEALLAELDVPAATIDGAVARARTRAAAAQQSGTPAHAPLRSRLSGLPRCPRLFCTCSIPVAEPACPTFPQPTAPPGILGALAVKSLEELQVRGCRGPDGWLDG